MSDNRLSSIPTTIRRPADRRPTLRTRITARLRAGRLDAMLAVGAPVPAGSPMAVRAARLTSTAEREAIARTLRRVIRDAASDRRQITAQVPLHRSNIAAATPLIEAITLRLHAPQPVRPRGMARLHRVLRDGFGPLYAFGHGDLTGRLGAALAAL